MSFIVLVSIIFALATLLAIRRKKDRFKAAAIGCFIGFAFLFSGGALASWVRVIAEDQFARFMHIALYGCGVLAICVSLSFIGLYLPNFKNRELIWGLVGALCLLLLLLNAVFTSDTINFATERGYDSLEERGFGLVIVVILILLVAFGQAVLFITVGLKARDPIARFRARLIGIASLTGGVAFAILNIFGDHPLTALAYLVLSGSLALYYFGLVPPLWMANIMTKRYQKSVK